MISLFSRANRELGKWSHRSMGVRRTFAAEKDLIHALLPRAWRILQLSDTPGVQDAATERGGDRNLFLAVDVARETASGSASVF